MNNYSALWFDIFLSTLPAKQAAREKINLARGLFLPNDHSVTLRLREKLDSAQRALFAMTLAGAYAISCCSSAIQPFRPFLFSHKCTWSLRNAHERNFYTLS